MSEQYNIIDIWMSRKMQKKSIFHLLTYIMFFIMETILQSHFAKCIDSIRYACNRMDKDLDDEYLCINWSYLKILSYEKMR